MSWLGRLVALLAAYLLAGSYPLGVALLGWLWACRWRL